MITLSLNHVHQTFYIGKKPVQVFTDITMKADTKQPVVIYGENGAGKTTLLRLVSGVLYPDQGAIVKQPENVFSYYLGSVDRFFYHRLSLLDNAAFFMAAFGVNPRDRLQQFTARLEAMQLHDLRHRWYFKLSQGQKKKAALAFLFSLPRPAIMALDEPWSHLDTVGKETLTNWIQSSKDTLYLLAQLPGTPVPFTHTAYTLTEGSLCLSD